MSPSKSVEGKWARRESRGWGAGGVTGAEGGRLHVCRGRGGQWRSAYLIEKASEARSRGLLKQLCQSRREEGGGRRGG